jgi:predicted RNase H-like nuclease (RuvC/YqgF family)
MKSSFYPQQAARQAVIQAQESAHQNEINTLKQELELARQQILSLQANNQNSISNSQNEIATLKAENKKLHNIINQQKAQLDAIIQNSKNIESEDKSKVKELEKSLIEKTKDLTIKDGIIQGLQEAVKVISSANASANNSPMPKIKESSLNNSPIKKHDESSQNLQNTNLLLGIDDILTVKSQVVEDNPQSMLLGEMCNKSTIQVSEEDL